MADSRLFDFSEDPVDPTQVGPTGQPLPSVPRPPIAGSTPASRHASATGAASVVETWVARESAYLQVVHNAVAINDYEAQAVLRWPSVTSVNSVRNALQDKSIARGTGPLFETDGFDVHTFTDTSGNARTTKRTRWRFVRR